MPQVVLHGPSYNSALQKVTPEAVSDAINPILDLKADKSDVDASHAARNAEIAQAQQKVDALTTSYAATTAAIATLQGDMAATDNRVSVLEGATPPPAVPAAVASFSLGATTNTTQVLAWTAPATGVALTFYDTRYKLAGSATWTPGPSVAVGTLTATVTGLNAGTNYDYSVVTRNAAGPGGASPTLTKATTTSFTPSPAWTKIPPATSITMNDGRVVTVSGGVIYINSVARTETNSVVLVEVSDTGVLYQENAFGNWWYLNAQNDWTFTSDPQATPPVTGVPAIAAAVGYNTLTFGPDVVTDSGWYVRDGTAVRQSDGAMRLTSASGWNGGYATALLTSGYMGFTGRAFGGGFYVRYTAKWTGGTGPESAEGTTVTGPGASITASQQMGVVGGPNFDTWGLNTSGQVLRNGAVIPISGAAPAPAAAVGYNTRTLGPRVVIGGANPNWFVNDGGTVFTTNPDGSVTLAGQSNNYNYGILTGDGHSFGIAFGGGMYIEIDCSWINPLNSTHGWPSLWANSVEGRLIPPAPAWPAGIAAGGFGDAIEWDIMETFSTGWGPTVWDWSLNSQYGVSTIGTTYSPFNFAWNAQGNVTSGPFDGIRRKIAARWVPATPTTQGRLEYYLNGALIPAMTNHWNLWNSAVGLPLVNGTTADSIMDFQHFTMLAGTGAENPMTIYSIEIWQKDGLSNLPPTGVSGTSGITVADRLYYHFHQVFAHTSAAWLSWNTTTSSWDAATDPSLATDGFPSLWASDIEGHTGFNLSNVPIQYPGRANGSNIWFDSYAMVDQGINASDYGSALWTWSNEFAGLQAALARKAFPGGAATRTSYHSYGWLWVPATPGVRGYMAYCFDDVEYQRVTWDYRANRSTLPSPPSITQLGGNTALLNVGSDLDWRHFFLQAGSGTASPIDVLKVEVFQASTAGNLSNGAAPPPPTGGPGPGPAFQDLAGGYQDMGNGQRCSTGIAAVTFESFRTGVYTLQIKPFGWNGIWRNGDTGNYLAPLFVAFVDRGRYLYLPDVSPIYSANGCPPVNPALNHITGLRHFVQWWTAGNITSPISWGLYYEPGFDTGDGHVYAVITDYKASRGDTFHVTGGIGSANLAGRGVCRPTSWGSILDFTGDSSGVPGFGLGWIAFIGHTITPSQIIADW
jgi:hypothetical protein